MPKKPQLDGEAIARAIQKDLPGWKRVEQQAPYDADMTDAEQHPHGPTLKQLRAKFLGESADSADSADAADAGEDYGALDSGRTSVTVEPIDGGPAKTVDIEGDEAKIVQG